MFASCFMISVCILVLFGSCFYIYAMNKHLHPKKDDDPQK